MRGLTCKPLQLLYEMSRCHYNQNIDGCPFCEVASRELRTINERFNQRFTNVCKFCWHRSANGLIAEELFDCFARGTTASNRIRFPFHWV